MPTRENFQKHVIQRGDIDSSNFLFHSDHISSTRWDDFRCGDYKTVSSLVQSGLSVRFIDEIYIKAHPLREQLGGLGLRGDVPRITVIITTYRTEGFRPKWVERTVRQYSSEEYNFLIEKVIVVWKNAESPPPMFDSPKVLVLKMNNNSLNNRWIQTIPHIDKRVCFECR